MKTPLCIVAVFGALATATSTPTAIFINCWGPRTAMAEVRVKVMPTTLGPKGVGLALVLTPPCRRE